MYFDQQDYRIRCEWGLSGIEALKPRSDVIVIVDVLSFSTCVEIATHNGAEILPYRFRDDSVIEFAASKNAIVAQRNRSRDTYSLSPQSLTNIPRGTRLVLPSPNGSTLTLAAVGKIAIAGCLRNAKAVAEYASQFESIAVIPCGERWEGGSIRFALEDLLGAGAIIRELAGAKSPEAIAAEATFNHFQNDLERTILGCASGRELVERGYEEDVRIACELNVSGTVPVFEGDAYGSVTI